MRNKNLLLIGSMVTLSVVTVSFLNPFKSDTQKYQPRKTDEPAKTGADQAMEHYRSMRLNPATGLYDEEYLRQSRLNAIADNEMSLKTSTMIWTEEGPDNVGGRTRAICIDRNDANHVFAGSVSGGLFVSFNGANNWQQVPTFDQYLRISSMCQTLDGTYYVGTGCTFDNWDGDGIFTSTDGINWTLVPGSQDFSRVNELQADPIVNNKIWIAGSNSVSGGLKSYIPGGGFVTPSGLTGTSTYQDIKISPDGTTLVCGKVSSGVQTYVSSDSGNSFTDVSGSAAGEIPATGRARMEYAISFDKNSSNNWTVYATAAGTNTCLKSVHISEDNGQTWTEIAPAGSSDFDPFANPGLNCQGWYDQICAAIPGQPDHCIVGGTQAVWKWKKSPTSNPTFGQWYMKSFAYASEFSPFYVHADQHEMRWDQNEILYIGSDGGVSKAFDKAENIFVSHNRGYNVTQFYSVAFNKFGHTMGGSQDNGTQYKDFTGVTSLEYREVNGGDGFDCDISHIFPETMFSTVYNGDFRRSDDEGENFEFFGAINPASSLPFNTVGRLYENPNDVNSLDSVMYISDSNYVAGNIIYFNSRTQQYPLQYTLTSNLNDGDTIKLQDPIQSIFAAGYKGSNGVYITREALRFNVDPDWTQVLNTELASSETVYCIEFSSDGNYMYVGTSSGLYIVKNLNTWYAPDYDASQLVVTEITGTGGINGIGVDPNDPDHILIAKTSGDVHETSSATTATTSASFSNVTGSLTSMPMYDCVIDYLDPNTFVIGTENGAYVSDDGGANWTWQAEMGLVPVYAVRQQWRTSDCWNHGVVYLGTFGRGIWSSNSLVGIIDADATAVAHADVTEINTYPNPMNNNGSISFKLKERNNVDIHIMDLTGKIVMSQSLGERNAGEVRADIDVTNLAAGTYVVMIRAGKETGTDKLVVTH